MGRDDGSVTVKQNKTTGKKPSGGNKPVSGKKPASGKKTTGGGKTASGKKTTSGGKPAYGKKITSGGKTASGKKTAGGRKPVAGKSTVNRKRPVSGKKPAGKKSAVRDAVSHSSAQGNRREEERARRRAERERKVRRQKIVMAVSSCIILLCVIGIAVVFLSPARVSLYLFQGDRAIAKEDYEKALSAYEKAVELKPSSVRAYCGLADSYRGRQMFTEAEQILAAGWEQTKDETVLRYYGTVILNQAVAQINAHECTLETVDMCVRVLEMGSVEEEALKLLGDCHERLFPETQEDACILLYDEDATQDTCSYTEYEGLLLRMIKVYKERPSEELKAVLKRYALIDRPDIRIGDSHRESYETLLTEIGAAINEPDMAQIQTGSEE